MVCRALPVMPLASYPLIATFTCLITGHNSLATELNVLLGVTATRFTASVVCTIYRLAHQVPIASSITYIPNWYRSQDKITPCHWSASTLFITKEVQHRFTFWNLVLVEDYFNYDR